jgi:hypothetical protein
MLCARLRTVTATFAEFLPQTVQLRSGIVQETLHDLLRNRTIAHQAAKEICFIEHGH